MGSRDTPSRNQEIADFLGNHDTIGDIVAEVLLSAHPLQVSSRRVMDVDRKGTHCHTLAGGPLFIYILHCKGVPPVDPTGFSDPSHISDGCKITGLEPRQIFSEERQKLLHLSGSLCLCNGLIVGGKAG